MPARRPTNLDYPVDNYRAVLDHWGSVWATRASWEQHALSAAQIVAEDVNAWIPASRIEAVLPYSIKLE